MNYEFQPTCQIPPETLDQIFTDAFGVKADGCFVEVGAHDGWHWSNTWGLAKAGWRGIYVEPVPELFEECVRTHVNHPHVEVTRCCIGAMNGEARLGMCEYGASLESKEREFTVNQITLNALLESFHVQPRFDLLVIDVEGGEEGVLAGFSCKDWMPKLVIIERPKTPNQFELLGYVTVYSDWINTVYLRKN